jgi:hypothetical protein
MQKRPRVTFAKEPKDSILKSKVVESEDSEKEPVKITPRESIYYFNLKKKKLKEIAVRYISKESLFYFDPKKPEELSPNIKNIFRNQLESTVLSKFDKF